MKQLLSILVIYFFSGYSFAQQNKFEGIWEGDVDAGMQKMRLVFYISTTASGSWKLAMQSPAQSPAQMPADTAIVENTTISMEMKKFNIRFSGKLLNDSTIDGKFIQGKIFPLQLKKVEKASVITKPKRPQTPKPPFSYQSLNVNFSSKDQSLRFAATLTLPDTIPGKKYPAVILISGSGPHDRDATMFGHKPFAVIADHLTMKGFAVLRTDERGIGKSTGNFSTATSADFANDAEAALDYLQQHASIDPKNIGFIGHSEGGQVAPMVASRRKDVKYIVLLAGPGIPCLDLMAEQNVAIFRSNGMSTVTAEAYGNLYKKLLSAIIQSPDTAAALVNGIKVTSQWKAADSVKQILKVSDEKAIHSYVNGMVQAVYSPWFRYFIAYDPTPALKNLSCAVLALNGSRDLQVLPASNLAGIKNALKKSKTKNYEVKEIPQLNHLFQTCNNCTMGEYSTLEESFSPLALEIITGWLLKQTGTR